MSGPVLFFDGVCNLCNHAVQFVIRHNKAGNIRFAPLQSESGRLAMEAVRARIGSVPDSLIFLEEGKYYTESDAALRVAAHLDAGWRWMRYLRIFPLSLRNVVYRIVAKLRYRLFGRRDQCMIPTPELRSRFLAL